MSDNNNNTETAEQVVAAPAAQPTQAPALTDDFVEQLIQKLQNASSARKEPVQEFNVSAEFTKTLNDIADANEWGAATREKWYRDAHEAVADIMDDPSYTKEQKSRELNRVGKRLLEKEAAREREDMEQNHARKGKIMSMYQTKYGDEGLFEVIKRAKETLVNNYECSPDDFDKLPFDIQWKMVRKAAREHFGFDKTEVGSGKPTVSVSDNLKHRLNKIVNGV